MAIRTGDPEMAREINRSLILGFLRNIETTHRAEIAKKLNLTKATVTVIINNLINEGLVKELGEGESQKTGGRKPVLITLNKSNSYIIGIDIGKTNTVVAISNLKGDIIKLIRKPTVKNSSVTNVIKQISNLVNKLIKESKIDRKKVKGVGVSVAGIVERNRGFIKYN